MLYPLASLWRQNCRIDIIESDTLEGVHAGRLSMSTFGNKFTGNTPKYFSHLEDALRYLRFWSGNPSAMAELHCITQRIGATGTLIGKPSDQALKILANLLVQGKLTLFEVPLRRSMPGRLAIPETASTESSPLADLPALDDVPAVPVLPALLPLLEDVQIEGAEVLPEIIQSLEQIDISLDNISSIAVSLEPTPDKVPPVKTAMEEAAEQITQTLDNL